MGCCDCVFHECRLSLLVHRQPHPAVPKELEPPLFGDRLVREARLRQFGKAHLICHVGQHLVAKCHHDGTKALKVIAERSVRHGIGKRYGPRHGVRERRDVGKADIPAQFKVCPHKIVCVRGKP